MVQIVRNVGGVHGLDVALDAFSEDVERHLFESYSLFVRTPEQGATHYGKERNGHVSGPQTWDPDVWKTLNLVGDTFPEHYVPPDYCLALSYPNGAQFKDHYDSRYRWGECIVGVCLGQAGVMYFVQQKGPTPETWQPVKGIDVDVSRQKCGKVCVEVTMPRRCIYRFYGPARLDWKHGIRTQTAARLKLYPPPPTWNRWNMRRSLTLRCHKAYSDAYLQHQLSLKPNDAHLQARWKQQKPFRPQNDYGGGSLSNADLELERQRGQRTLQQMLNSPFRHLRWGDADGSFHTFTGHGNLLGGDAVSQVIANVAGQFPSGVSQQHQQEDADLQAAMRASLSEQRKQSSGSDVEDADIEAAIRLSLGEASPQASSNGGTASDPISLDDDDEEEGNDKNTESSNGNTKRAASEKEEDEESKRKRLRLARISRFADL